MRQAIYIYTVEGKGRFPYDMLRYDQCWPRVDTTGLGLDYGSGTRRVQLAGISHPTEARWSSFGWYVVDGVEVVK